MVLKGMHTEGLLLTACAKTALYCSFTSVRRAAVSTVNSEHDYGILVCTRTQSNVNIVHFIRHPIVLGCLTLLLCSMLTGDRIGGNEPSSSKDKPYA